MHSGDYGLNILIDGEPAPERWDVDGGCAWIEAERGKTFALLLANRSDGRVCAVSSIDGLSVMDGQPARHDSQGYMLPARSEVVVPGWRLDDASVAQFQFGVAAKGYARQMGHSPRNVGVIAAAFFRERYTPPPRTPIVPPRRGGCLFGWFLDEPAPPKRAEPERIEPMRVLTRSQLRHALELAQGELAAVLLADGTVGVADSRWFTHDYITDRLGGEATSEFWIDVEEDLIVVYPIGTDDGEGGVAPVWMTLGLSPGDDGRLIGELRQARSEDYQPFAVRKPMDAPFAVRKPAPVAVEEEDTDNVAVTFGPRAGHVITTVEFYRATPTPDAILSIRYDTASGLRSRSLGCPVPPGWTGG